MTFAWRSDSVFSLPERNVTSGDHLASWWRKPSWRPFHRVTVCVIMFVATALGTDHRTRIPRRPAVWEPKLQGSLVDRSARRISSFLIHLSRKEIESTTTKTLHRINKNQIGELGSASDFRFKHFCHRNNFFFYSVNNSKGSINNTSHPKKTEIDWRWKCVSSRSDVEQTLMTNVNMTCLQGSWDEKLHGNEEPILPMDISSRASNPRYKDYTYCVLWA